MNVRTAAPEEFDQIYRMGFDAWSNGTSMETYLEQCRTSPKYRKGRWFVLSDGRELLSSLIVYDFGGEKFGIGSIATPKEKRKNGHASTLVRAVIESLERDTPGAVTFLYSDIDSKFYGKFGFVALRPEGQRYQTTTCMVRSENVERFLADKQGSPPYF